MVNGLLPRRIRLGAQPSVLFGRHAPSRQPLSRSLIPNTQPFSEAEDELIIQRRLNGQSSFRAIAEEMDRAEHRVYGRFLTHLLPATPELQRAYKRRTRRIRPYKEWENKLIISGRKEGNTYAVLALKLAERGSKRNQTAIRNHIWGNLVRKDPALLATIKYDVKLSNIAGEGVQAGKSMEQVARETGISRAVLYAHANLFPTAATKWRSFTKNEIDRIIRMRGKRKTWDQISETLGKPIGPIKIVYYKQRRNWQTTSEEAHAIQSLEQMGASVVDIARETDLPLWIIKRELGRLQKREAPNEPARKLRTLRRWSAADRQHLLEMQKAGHTPREMAEQLNTKVHRIYGKLRALSDQGVDMENRTKRIHQRYTTKEILKITHLRNAKRLPWNDVAKHMPGATGRNIAYMYRHWRRQGVIKADDAGAEN